MFLELERANTILKVLKKDTERNQIQIEQMETGMGKERPDCWTAFEKNQLWGGRDCWQWFRFTVTIPAHYEGKRSELLFTTKRRSGWNDWNEPNVSLLIYVNGELVQGVDENHRSITLSFDEKGGTTYQVEVAAYHGNLGMLPEDEPERCEMIVTLQTRNERTEQLYFDMLALYETAILYEKGEYVRIVLEEALKKACNLLDLRIVGSEEYDASVEKAIASLKEFYDTECGEKKEIANCIGHTHIDVAYRWTLEQTEQKAIRSFSTVLELMKEYPDYFFISSQPQLYQFVKKLAPNLYEKIKERIAEGRWEAEGAMWVEADTNLTSGESLIRQIVYGKRFFREEFGKECKILWLPDVFGYSAALPQILKKSGIEYFVTSKISWNEYNRMPYDTFLWQGIDGSEIFTQFINAAVVGSPKTDFFSTYSGVLCPEAVQRGWEKYQQKRNNPETLFTFGYGDGGGGSTREMIEMNRRLEKGIPGCVQTKIRPVSEILERIRKNAEEKGALPKWVGELYLELHRGTYTSMARNKRANRKGEFLLESAEKLSVLGMLLLNRDYPAKRLDENWEILLLNQFHDIIPGSSIKEVYDDSLVQYQALKSDVTELTDSILQELAENVNTSGILCYNPTSFERNGVVEKDGTTVYVENIPPMGYCVVQPVTLEKTMSVSKSGMENEFLRVSFDEKGRITEIYDKKAERQVLEQGKYGNVFTVFEDRPKKYQAWDINIYYQEKSWDVEELKEFEVACDTAEKVSVKIIRSFLNSTIEQRISLYYNNPTIVFTTKVDWKESNLLLKVAFPVEVLSPRATYEIQYGAIERPTHWNTSWDTAKFEVCGQKWADLSEEGYGVALLNDCKYGYDIKENVMRLTLIKSGVEPNPVADQEEHFFTYALFPHAGSWQESGVVKQAALLNQPIKSSDTQGLGALTGWMSLVKSHEENIVIEVVKQATNGEGIVIRAYESQGKRGKENLELGFSVQRAFETDLEEHVITEVPLYENSITLEWKPFEIKTLLFVP